MAVERVYEAGSLDSESKLNNITSERFTRFTSAEIEYIVTEVETEEEAIAEVREQAPEVYQNMTIQGYSVSERCGTNAWRVAANYAYVQGEKTAIDNFLYALFHEHNYFTSIDDYSMKKLPLVKEDSFRILY